MIKKGDSRVYLFLGNYVWKFPNIFKGWSSFLRAMIENLNERKLINGGWNCLCPIVFSDILGLLVIMKRAESISAETYVDYKLSNYLIDQHLQNYVADKVSSFGLYKGRIVVVSYGKEIPSAKN